VPTSFEAFEAEERGGAKAGRRVKAKDNAARRLFRKVKRGVADFFR
jgi:hypothetical protein